MRKIFLCAFLVLAACATGGQEPAPAVSYGYGDGGASAGMYTATGTETVWSITQAYHLPMQDIIRINRLQPPFALKPGQRLKLPAPRAYVARPADTVYSISRMFDVSPNELARMNALHDPYAVTPGETLRLPPSPMPKAPPPMPAPQTPYSVAGGYGAAGAAERFPLYGDGSEDARPVYPGAVAPAVVVASPSLPSPEGRRNAVGENGIQAEALPPVPPAATAGETGMPPQPVLPQPVSPQPMSRQPMSPQSASPQLASVPPEEARSAPPPVVLAADTPARAGSLFGWPVSGPILSSYGTKAGGLHNDGINIKAARGTAVRAAENGVIVYADNQLKGFGNLVLVRHADRWMTAYAHMDDIKVRRGQVVHKGDTLGTVGDTGGVTGPQLHFELRHGTEALNPVAFLERQGT